MYKAIKLQSNAFKKKRCDQRNGILCPVCSKTFINYQDECFYNSSLKIYVCTKCRPVKERKYKNNPRLYNGRTYHSELEAKHAQKLDILKRAGIVKLWRPQEKIPLKVNGHQVCNYFCDFYVEYSDGKIELHETKGFETDVFKLKRALMELTYLKENPGIEYIMIFDKKHNIKTKKAV